MEIGIALPDHGHRASPAATFVEWCRGIDEGPYSSVSAGERITFHNPELLVTNTAAAALTERVQVITNIAVLPLHRPALLAKQLATLDVLADGRLVVGVGRGRTRAGLPVARRPLRGTPPDGSTPGWPSSGGCGRAGPPTTAAQPVGPAPRTPPGGPPLWAAAMGPKSMARAARWADGVTGFSIGADPGEIARGNRLALDAWEADGRAERPQAGQRHLLPAGRGRRRRRAASGSPGPTWPCSATRAADALSRLVGLSSPGPAARHPGRRRGGRVRRVHPGARHGRPRLPGAHHRRPGRLTRRPLTRVRTDGGSDREVLALPDTGRRRRADLGRRGPGRGPRCSSASTWRWSAPRVTPDQVGQQGVVDVERRRSSLRGRLRAMTWPGTPTTTESGGTSRTTTALAPMRLPRADGDRPEHLGAGADGDPVARRSGGACRARGWCRRG